MKKYILLGDICFDWSGGDYSNRTVYDVYLGYGEFENEEAAQIESDRLLKEYCGDDYSALDYESYAKVKEI